MTTETKQQEQSMTNKGTVQLSMNIDPDLKTDIRIAALREGVTMTEWVLKWIEIGLSESKNE